MLSLFAGVAVRLAVQQAESAYAIKARTLVTRLCWTRSAAMSCFSH